MGQKFFVTLLLYYAEHTSCILVCLYTRAIIKISRYYIVFGTVHGYGCKYLYLLAVGKKLLVSKILKNMVQF